MKKSISDTRLNTLWSDAVKALYKCDPLSGDVNNLHAHHVIGKGRQNRFSIRWDIRNGVPLSPENHRKLHDMDLKVTRALIDHIEKRGDLEYLQSLKNKLKHEFLKDLGLSENQYRMMVALNLKRIIKENS